MKEMKNIQEYNNDEWMKLSSMLSDEKDQNNNDLLSRFMADDSYETAKNWKELKEMNNENEINVDKAWDKLFSRLDRNGLINEKRSRENRFTRSIFLRIAATAVIILGIGSVLFYLNDKGILAKDIVVATTDNQKNLQVSLPDGSVIFLNRNTRLSYPKNFGKNVRSVNLSGEAFFEITPDVSMPFTVDAGRATVKVVGTSFNVLTNDTGEAVEVFVKTGQVMLADNSGPRNLVLDPGFIGTIDQGKASKELNNDPNYLSWNTGMLFYDGQKLDVVLRDLKKVYNMDIVADDPGILENTWTSPIDNQPQETIIRLICISFNLSYSKDGNVYHLSEK